MRRWEAGQARPGPDDLQNLVAALDLCPLEASFLETAFVLRGPESAPEEPAYRRFLAEVAKCENPVLVFDGLLFPRARNSLSVAVNGLRALSLEFRHPLADLLTALKTAKGEDRLRLDAELQTWLRHFWLATAGLCGSPSYQQLVAEFARDPLFCERWLRLATEPTEMSYGAAGAAFLTDRGELGVFRVLPLRVTLPPDYRVLEFQPHDDVAKASVAAVRGRMRPFLVENPVRHWSQDRQSVLRPQAWLRQTIDGEVIEPNFRIAGR